MITVNAVKCFHKFEKRAPQARALIERRVRKIDNFEPISRRISETVRQ